MKKLCLLLAVLLLLAGCAAPAETPVPSAPVSSAEQSVSSQPDSTLDESSAASSEISSEVSSEVSSEESAVTSEETVSSQAPEMTSSESAELPSSAVPETSSENSETPVSSEEHSPLYIPGLNVEDVIWYFNEVCLDAEYSVADDINLVQKWDEPIYYGLYGSYTAEDAEMVKSLVGVLNEIEGFPGMHQIGEDDYPNLWINFWSDQELVDQMGSVVNYEAVDGAVEFSYDGENRIYYGRIGVRCDIDQYLRNSVILEEIYNGMGPIQDTWSREDSIAYAGYSDPQWLTEVDVLIMKLLYHPDIHCGMNADACEDVIRSLYY